MRHWIPILVTVLLVPPLGGCTSPLLGTRPDLFELADSQADLDLVWQSKLLGTSVDLSIAQTSGHVLLSVHPDRAISREVVDPTLFLYTSEGVEKQRISLPARVRDIAISDDGLILVAQLYNGELSRWNVDGTLKWSVKAFCKPYILAEGNQVLCVYDDDNRPDVVFEVFDQDGKKIYTYGTKEEVGLFKVDRSQSLAAISYRSGRIEIIDLVHFKKVLSIAESKETIDLAVKKAALGFQVAGLFFSRKNPIKGHFLKIFENAEPVFEESLGNYASQISWKSNSDRICLFGNSPRGQHIRELGSVTTRLWQTVWEQTIPHFADFAPISQVMGNSFLVGLELFEKSSSSKKNFLLNLDNSGRLFWSIALPLEEGGYIYSTQNNADSEYIRLVVATEASKIRGFKIKRF